MKGYPVSHCNKDSQLTVGELFAGMGGIGLVFKQAGFKISWANEINKKACITYQENFNHRLIQDDIRNVKPCDLGEVDILTEGFPCQTFVFLENVK
ncbi:DNA cytosine methyltransferase [Candidatus Liberibacter africanus]|uniref:DNA (cytosine-5-)-methyltransferase n=1 Tax=Candidatus Liberibacter africanus PTSAPSY TaxID=1277257 RepID=A0A0G3I3T6_LIBAF|nr:DNA cytosine methyltransferase [Candidatus Liberibacter africanus]AKK20529.1 cytosine-specific DNA-methyltransferase [Candidatus Liberibacter africanus PTSAPSY]QTP64236.1 DNA cytosine methyltransferase [Candidatus Liberibacter africanus]